MISDDSQLTYNHEGEKVSIEEVEQDWLVPGFHANHGSNQVNKGDSLEGDKTQIFKLLDSQYVTVVTENLIIVPLTQNFPDNYLIILDNHATLPLKNMYPYLDTAPVGN